MPMLQHLVALRGKLPANPKIFVMGSDATGDITHVYAAYKAGAVGGVVIFIWGGADAEKMKIQAEAAASHNRVALDKMLIDQLPQIVEKAALGLSGANLTVLNGAEGLSQVASGLVAQGKTIFDALRGGVIDAVRAQMARYAGTEHAGDGNADHRDEQHAASVEVCECRELVEHGYAFRVSRVW